MELTEKETEYVVSCIKHIYPKHVVFQFNVTNNVEDQQLEDVTVEMEVCFAVLSLVVLACIAATESLKPACSLAV